MPSNILYLYRYIFQTNGHTIIDLKNRFGVDINGCRCKIRKMKLKGIMIILSVDIYIESILIKVIEGR